MQRCEEERIESPPFFACGAEWRLIVWPHGLPGSRGDGTHLSAYPKCLSLDQLPLDVEYTLRAGCPGMLALGAQEERARQTFEPPACTDWGWSRMVRRKDQPYLLRDGELRLTAELRLMDAWSREVAQERWRIELEAEAASA